MFIWLSVADHVISSSSEDSVEVRKEIDTAFNDVSAILSFVTFVNVFYCLLVFYAIVIVLYGIITVKKMKTERLIVEKLKSVKTIK